MLGKHISILEPSILVEETEELIELLKQGDRIHNYETLRLRKDGTIINISLTLSPIFDTYEKLVAISVISRDITKSKRSDEKLWKNEQMYWVVTEQTDQVIYESDLRTGKCNWTGAIEEVKGYSFEKLKESGEYFWSQNIHRADTNHMDKKSQDMRISEGRSNEKSSLIRKYRTCIYMGNSGICLTDHEKRPYGAIGILKDITSIIFADRKDQVMHVQNEVVNNEENINFRMKGTLQDIDEHKIESN